MLRLPLVVAAIVATSTGVQAAVVEVHLVETDDGSYAFDPEVVRVDVGDTVRWVNDGPAYHTVSHGPDPSVRRTTSESAFDETLTGARETFSFTFGEAGAVHYFCQPHRSSMAGRVLVGDAEDPGPGDASHGAPALPLVGVVAALALAALLRRRW